MRPAVLSNPQSVRDLRARFWKAVRRTYSWTEIMDFMGDRPGENPDCVFDFGCGLRLIVSREVDEAGTPHLHLSASVSPNSQEVETITRLMKTARHRYRDVWANSVLARFNTIALPKYRDGLTLIGWSDKGVPHWHKVLTDDK